MLFRLCVLFLVSALASACVMRTAGAAVNTGADAGLGAAKTDVKATGAMADAATPNRKKRKVKIIRAHDRTGPFDETRDADADIDRALAAAQENGKNVLLVLGGNWCHDSRGLADKFKKPELAAVLAESYEVVWVDIGYRKRNMHVPPRFGVDDIYGTPTVLILSPEGALLNRATVHDWRAADSEHYGKTLRYFEAFAGGEGRAP